MAQKALKIALVIPGFQSSPEDWCIPVFTNLAHELSDRVELHVFALRYPPRRDDYLIGKVHVHSMGAGLLAGQRAPGLSLARLWLAFLLEISHEHSRAPFSTVLGVWATEAGFLATRAAKRLGVPSLVHLAGGELTYLPQISYGNLGRGLAGLLVASTLSSADLLTAPSGPMLRALLKRVEKDRARAWAPGVNTSMFSPVDHRGGEAKPFAFVTVGSLVPVKGHSLLLCALAQVRSESSGLDVRLRIVGDGPLRQRLEMMAHNLGLEGYVAFEGDAPHDALPTVYRESEGFLLGSWHEAQCMAAIEAMSCGLSWVGPPVGALADASRSPVEAMSGITFTSRDAREIADAMRAMMLLGRAERRAWGEHARNFVLQNYELTHQTDALMDIIGELTR